MCWEGKKTRTTTAKIHFLHIVNYAAHASSYSSLGSGRGYIGPKYFGGSRKC